MLDNPSHPELLTDWSTDFPFDFESPFLFRFEAFVVMANSKESYIAIYCPAISVLVLRRPSFFAWGFSVAMASSPAKSASAARSVNVSVTPYAAKFPLPKVENGDVVAKAGAEGAQETAKLVVSAMMLDHETILPAWGAVQKVLLAKQLKERTNNLTLFKKKPENLLHCHDERNCEKLVLKHTDITEVDLAALKRNNDEIVRILTSQLTQLPLTLSWCDLMWIVDFNYYIFEKRAIIFKASLQSAKADGALKVAGEFDFFTCGAYTPQYHDTTTALVKLTYRSTGEVQDIVDSWITRAADLIDNHDDMNAGFKMPNAPLIRCHTIFPEGKGPHKHPKWHGRTASKEFQKWTKTQHDEWTRVVTAALPTMSVPAKETGELQKVVEEQKSAKMKRARDTAALKASERACKRRAKAPVPAEQAGS